MKKMSLCLGIAISFCGVVQANQHYSGVETFPVVPRSTLEVTSLPLEVLKPLEPAKINVEPPRVNAPIYTSPIENKSKSGDDIDVMEMIRKEHARNVAKDKEKDLKKAPSQASKPGAKEKSKPAVAKKSSVNPRKPAAKPAPKASGSPKKTSAKPKVTAKPNVANKSGVSSRKPAAKPAPKANSSSKKTSAKPKSTVKKPVVSKKKEIKK